jgi:hypothetical protein
MHFYRNFKSMKNLHRYILILITIFIVSVTFTGEKAINLGAGWDGLLYREMAKSFSDQIQDESYMSYYLKRTLPWAVINIAYNGLGISKSDANLLLGALIINLIFMALAIISYFNISNFYKFHSGTETLGYSLLFFNFFFLKQSGYYPFLNDIIAFSLMLIAYNFFIRKKFIFLLITGILAAFTWYHAWLLVFILLVIPKISFDITNKNKTDVSISSLKSFKIIKFGVIISYIIIASLIVYYFLFMKDGTLMTREDLKLYGRGENLYLISIFGLFFCYLLYLIMKPINYNIKHFFSKLYKNINYSNILVGLLVFIGLEFVFRLTKGEGNLISFYTYVIRTIRPTLTLPLHNFEAFFMYYGVSISLLVILWKRYLFMMGKIGFPFIFILLYMLLIGVTTESRALAHVFPFIVIPLLIILNRDDISNAFVSIIATFQIVLSRFWREINITGFYEAVVKESNKADFPLQSYYLNHGPWQSNSIYLLFLICFIISTVLLWIYLRNYLSCKNK